MSIDRPRFDPEASRLIKEQDVEALRAHFSQFPERVNWYTPYAGGTWLHFAAAEGNAEILDLLIEFGIDVNRPSLRDDARLSIVDACDHANVENVRYLLETGSEMDTSATVRNPLFAAIVGRSIGIVRLLLQRGIDASIQYPSDVGTNVDAISFALQRGENAIAELVASHLADNEPTRVTSLLSDASRRANAQPPLQQRRILPNEEDFMEE